MATLDRNFTDELRMRLSIVDVVGRRVPLTRKGQNYWGCCPFHNEKQPSFSVNEEKGVLSLFRLWRAWRHYLLYNENRKYGIQGGDYRTGIPGGYENARL